MAAAVYENGCSGTLAWTKVSFMVQLANEWIPNPPNQPAATEKTARIRSGTVMAGGDSWGRPWPRNSPKKVSQMQRPM